MLQVLHVYFGVGFIKLKVFYFQLKSDEAVASLVTPTLTPLIESVK